MKENELQERRRKRLASWLDTHGGITKLLDGRNTPPSYPSFISQVLGGYSFGSRAARTCEERLGIPPQWLDLPDSQPATETAKNSVVTVVRAPPTLADAFAVLGAALAVDMPDDVRDDVADALAKLARRRGALRDQQLALHMLEEACPGTATAPGKRAA